MSNLSTLSVPLNNLKKKNVKFEWSPECDRAFIEIKDKVCNAVSLVIPDFSKTFEVHCDASDYGLGA